MDNCLILFMENNCGEIALFDNKEDFKKFMLDYATWDFGSDDNFRFPIENEDYRIEYISKASINPKFKKWIES